MSSLHLVLVPTYNERENIQALLDAICVHPDVHVLVIDDASPDGTANEVTTHPFFEDRVFLLSREGKQGLGAAYRAGFAWGFERPYETLTQMDADFSHHPEDLPRLLAEIEGGADVAIGSRRVHGGQIVGWSLWRQFSSAAAMTASRVLLGLKTKDVTAGFRTWRRGFIERLPVLSLKSNGYAFQEEMMLTAEQHGAAVREVPVTFRDRERGASKLGLHEIQEFFYTLGRLTLIRRKRFAMYAVIGAMGSVVDLGGFVFFHHHFGMGVLEANILATSIAVLHNFLWHNFVTFKKHRKRTQVAFVEFIAVSLVGMILNSLVVLAGVSVGLWPVVAKILAIGCVTVWNYLLNSRVTFKV
ncbi:MAG: glycosyltransferase family 2 protein [Patescibacteria group bacterium]